MSATETHPQHAQASHAPPASHAWLPAPDRHLKWHYRESFAMDGESWTALCGGGYTVVEHDLPAFGGGDGDSSDGMQDFLELPTAEHQTMPQTPPLTPEAERDAPWAPQRHQRLAAPRPNSSPLPSLAPATNLAAPGARLAGDDNARLRRHGLVYAAREQPPHVRAPTPPRTRAPTTPLPPRRRFAIPATRSLHGADSAPTPARNALDTALMHLARAAVHLPPDSALREALRTFALGSWMPERWDVNVAFVEAEREMRGDGYKGLAVEEWLARGFVAKAVGVLRAGGEGGEFWRDGVDLEGVFGVW